METALSTCKPSGSPGIDNVTNNMLKLCPLNVKTRINTIFNASLKLGHLPDQWKKANIKLIHKNKKPKDKFNSYRPISLISCVSKWIEKINVETIFKWSNVERDDELEF